jgi:hypothetical protein
MHFSVSWLNGAAKLPRIGLNSTVRAEVPG